MYVRASLPKEYNADRVQEELERLEQALKVTEGITLVTLFVEPPKRREGLTVLADGTTWNPGSGQGVYTYYAGAWHKLG